jgi:hypothetical protein
VQFSPALDRGGGVVAIAGEGEAVKLQYRLDAVNFFLADVRGGLGAFVGIFLVTAAGWSPLQVGEILALSGLIGISMHAPVGALIDSIRAKRALLIGAAALLALCAVAIVQWPTRGIVFSADVTMAILGGVFGPTVVALTIGLVPAKALPNRLARNAVFDRIGNITVVLLVGYIGWRYGQRAIFYCVPIFALLSAASIASIPPTAIDHDRARGFSNAGTIPQNVFSLLTGNRPLILLALIVATFHFANAAMMTLVGQRLAIAHPGFESAFLAACLLIAQLVTIPVAYLAGQATRGGGRASWRWLLVIACVALSFRGFMFASLDGTPTMLAAQLLDGVSGGIWDVLMPLAVLDFTADSGRNSFSRGVLGTVQGIAGSLSNAFAGGLVAWGGYDAGFWGLTAFALLSCGLVALLPGRKRVPSDPVEPSLAGC